MAIYYQVYPAYYGTIAKETGLGYAEIEKYSKLNRVYITEMEKAVKMQESGRSTENILAYFKTQGYNSIQLGEISGVLSKPKVDATTGLTKSQQIEKTVNDVKKIALGLAEVATAFGLINRNAVNVSQIPVFDASQFTGIPQSQTFGIDPTTGKIVSQGNTPIVTPVVTPPAVSASGLPDWINTTTVLIFFGALLLIYLATNSGNSQRQNEYQYSNKRYR
jgi:hypothetical protein